MATGALVLLESPRGEAYVIGAQDILTVEVPDLRKPGEIYAQSLEVEADGYITMPLIGRIQCEGQTILEIRGRITAQLAENFLVDPLVAVTVREFRSKRIAVLGPVQRPGIIPLQRNSATVVEALALAGGLGENSGTRALLVRKAGKASGPGLLDVDVEALAEGDLSNNYIVFPGDVLQVLPAERYFVSGFVNEPGEFRLQRTTTLLEAIAIAGGVVVPDASPDMTRIRRYGQLPIDIDLVEVAEGTVDDPVIEPGDIVEVRQGFWRGAGLEFYRFIKGGIGFGYNLAAFIPPF